MIHKLQTFVIRIIAGANITSILLMLLIGYSSRLDPVSHPTLSTFGLGFPIILTVNLCFLVFWVIFKFRWVFIPLVGLILAYGPIRTYVPFNLKSTPPDDAIKVLSYNVWNLSAWEDKDQPNPVYAYLAEQNADIVCLQEVSKAQCGRKAIEKAFGQQYQYSDTSDAKNGGDILCVLSKYPILKKENITYDSKTNHSTAFYLLVNHDTVIVINNHLESTHLSTEQRNNFSDIVKGEMEHDSARVESKRLINKISEASVLRAPETVAVAEYIEQHKQYSLIACGDFNDSPISYTHYRMSQYLQDCFVESGTGFGFTYHHHGMHVRIDHIFCSPYWESYSCYVDNETSLSDHYPIITWLKKGENLKN